MTSPSSLSTEKASPHKLLALTAWQLHEQRYPPTSPLGSSLAPPPAPEPVLLVPTMCLGRGLGTGQVGRGGGGQPESLVQDALGVVEPVTVRCWPRSSINGKRHVCSQENKPELWGRGRASGWLGTD